MANLLSHAGREKTLSLSILTGAFKNPNFGAGNSGWNLEKNGI
jgi:hypothetical protein